MVNSKLVTYFSWWVGWIGRWGGLVSQSQFSIDLALSFKLKLGLGKKIALYVPRFNSDGSLKSKTSHLENLRFFNFQAMDPKFVLALETG